MPTLKSSKTPSNFQSTNSCSNSIYFSFTASHELQFRICRAAAEVHKSPQNAMRRHYKCYASVVKMLIEYWHWENMIRKKWTLIDHYVCLIFSIKLNMSYVRCLAWNCLHQDTLNMNFFYIIIIIMSLSSLFFFHWDKLFFTSFWWYSIFIYANISYRLLKWRFFKRYPVYNDAR